MRKILTRMVLVWTLVFGLALVTTPVEALAPKPMVVFQVFDQNTAKSIVKGRVDIWEYNTGLGYTWKKLKNNRTWFELEPNKEYMAFLGTGDWPNGDVSHRVIGVGFSKGIVPLSYEISPYTTFRTTTSNGVVSYWVAPFN